MKPPPKRITADVVDVVEDSGTASRPGAQLVHAEPTASGAVRFVHVDERRVLPGVPERYLVPVDFVHDHPKVRAAGGLSLIVETVAELMPGVRFDKPETIPPPARAVMRAIHKRAPFGLVIIAGQKLWWVDLRTDLPKALPHG